MTDGEAEFDDAELERAYVKWRPRLDEARDRLEDLLKEAIARLPHGRLVRAYMPQPHMREHRANPRIKTFGSLRRKAIDRGWRASEAVGRADDLVGGRVVCYNLEDVYRFEALLEEMAAPVDGPAIRRRDLIQEPTAAGYRSLHLYVPLDVGRPLWPQHVTCEVQVRTLLQHAWAELSHHDLYKHGEELPGGLSDRFRSMSETLAAVDEQASEVRECIMRRRPPPEGRPGLETLSAEGLVFLFATTFGREPAEYTIRTAMETCKQVGLDSLEPLAEVVRSDDAREAVASAYASETRWRIDREELFEILPVAASSGIDAAVAEARRRGKTEWREIEAQARSEILAELPASFEEFLNELRRGALNVGLLAKVLDGAVACWICGTDLVDPERFALAVCEHYGAGEDAPIVDKLYGSMVPTTATGSSGLCDYHAHVLSRED